MKTRLMFHQLSVCVAVYIACTACPATAQTLTDLSGIWRIVGFSVPSQLTLIRTNQCPVPRKVIKKKKKDRFELGNGMLSVNSQGAFSGTFEGHPTSGAFSIAGQGRVVVHPDGEIPLNFSINSSLDFMASVTSETSQDFQDLTLLTKAPASIAPSEVAGDWHILSMNTPDRLTLVTTNGFVRDIPERSHFETGSGTLTLNTNGTLSGFMDNAFTGAYSLGANGEVSVTVTNLEEEVFSVTLFINAGKNIMIAGEPDAESGYQEVLIFTKAPVSATIADLKGHWHIAAFGVPNQLTLSKDGDGDVVDIFEKTRFEFEEGSLMAGHNGFFTSQFEGSSTGNFSLGSPGVVTVTETDEEGQESFSMRVNAARDVIVGVTADSFNQELFILTKSPPSTNSAQNLGFVMFPSQTNLVFNWASDVTRKLQCSTNLLDWDDVPGTLATNAHEVALPSSQTNKYFRVIETP